MSIVTERRRLADVGLVLREREEWDAVFDYSSSRQVDIADQLVGHIAVVDDPGDLLGTEDQVMRNIERIGITRFPSTGYSYNAAAFNTGRLYEGQPLERRGAHTVNDRRRETCSQSGCPNRGDSLTAPSWNNNVNARAIVAPQMPGDPCTDAQVTSFARWGAGLILAGFARSSARWHGHRCYAAKDCPSSQVWARLDDVQDLTADYVRAGHVGSTPEDDMTPEERRMLTETHALAKKYLDAKNSGIWGKVSAMAPQVDAVHGRIIRKNYLDTGLSHARDTIVARVAALTAAVEHLATGLGADPEAIRQAAEDGARAALQDMIDDARTELVVEES